MKFQVLWNSAAESELTRLWLAAEDRDVLAGAADRIDIRLRHDPLRVGESRAGNLRIVHEQPLGAEFILSLDDLTVNVIRVWRFRDPHQNG